MKKLLLAGLLVGGILPQVTQTGSSIGRDEILNQLKQDRENLIYKRHAACGGELHLIPLVSLFGLLPLGIYSFVKSFDCFTEALRPKKYKLHERLGYLLGASVCVAVSLGSLTCAHKGFFFEFQLTTSYNQQINQIDLQISDLLNK